MKMASLLAPLAFALLAGASAMAADPGKVFRYAFEVAETGFDPAQISDLYSSNLIANVFDAPLTYDYLARPIKLIPNTLAAMPEVTENGTLYTMRVKPGIFFADDEAFKGRQARAHRRGLRLLDKAALRPEDEVPQPVPAGGPDRRDGRSARRGAARRPDGLRDGGRGPANPRPLHLPDPAEAAQLQLPLLPRLLQPLLRGGPRGRRVVRRPGGGAPGRHGPLPARVLEALLEARVRGEPRTIARTSTTARRLPTMPPRRQCSRSSRASACRWWAGSRST